MVHRYICHCEKLRFTSCYISLFLCVTYTSYSRYLGICTYLQDTSSHTHRSHYPTIARLWHLDTTTFEILFTKVDIFWLPDELWPRIVLCSWLAVDSVPSVQDHRCLDYLIDLECLKEFAWLWLLAANFCFRCWRVQWRGERWREEERRGETEKKENNNIATVNQGIAAAQHTPVEGCAVVLWIVHTHKLATRIYIKIPPDFSFSIPTKKTQQHVEKN